MGEGTDNGWTEDVPLAGMSFCRVLYRKAVEINNSLRMVMLIR
jgi:hypothetical protein